MASGFSTQAVNFTDTLSSDVDPRTGQFNFTHSLATLSANRHLGPIAELNLTYSPLNDGDMGFGNRIKINISRFDASTNTLYLNTGETYKVTPGTVQIKNRKAIGFIFEFIRPGNASLGYRITWKDGTKEELTSPYNNNQFVTQKIESPLGRKMTFSWLLNSGKTYLRAIDDEYSTLLNVTYGSSLVTVTQYPETDEAVVTSLYMQNSNQLSRITRQVSATETLTWLFEYTLTGPSSTSTLTKVTYPTRLIEQVTYSTNSGNSLMYPPASGLGWLPVVTTHTKAPGFGQPAITANWKFDVEGSKNFLGYTGNFGTWTADSDYTYSSLLSTYIYGSTVTTGSGSNTETTTYRYNNYHLQISEDRRSGTTRYLTETEYYALVNTTFENQPLNFQLPKKVTKTWSDTSLPAGQQTRSEITLTEFDIYGNPTREQAPDGAVTETVWYAATGEAGCPAEPNGFVRFMKSQTVTPAKTEFHTPTQKTTLQYKKLGSSSCIVLTEQHNYSDDIHISSELYNYNSVAGNSEFGRLTQRVNTLFDPEDGTTGYTSSLDITSTVSSGRLKQSTLFKGHDGLTAVSSQEISALSGLKFSETSIQNVKTEFSYDLSGRIIQKNYAVNSQYEKRTTWQYAISDSGLSTTEILDTGVSIRTWFDGLGRQTSQERYDPDNTKTWYTISTASWDTQDVMYEGSASDHQLNGVKGPISARISTTNSVDGWGNINNSISSDGIISKNELSPVTLIRKEEQQSGDSALSSGVTLTKLDISGRPLEITVQNNNGNLLSSTKFQRDGLGRVCRYTDAEGNVTRFTWDIYNRETSKTLADGTIITRRYAPWLTDDCPISIKIQGANTQGTTNWTIGLRDWDSLGRLISETVGGRTTKYKYSDSSNTPSEAIVPSGDAINYTYIPELGNALKSLKSGSLNQHFSYAPKNGLMLSAVDNTGTSLTRSYLTSGKMKEETTTGTDGKTYSLFRTSSLLGANLTQTDYDGTLRQYQYDSYGRIILVEEPTAAISVEYDGLARASKSIIRDKATNETLTTTLEFDELGRELNRTITDSRGSTLTQRMSRRNDGRMNARETQLNNSTVCTESFTYDVRNRLTRWVASGSELPEDNYGHPLRLQTFSYDVLGNTTEVVTILSDGTEDKALFEYSNSQDPTQLTALTHTHSGYPARITLSYDANGRLTSDEAGRLRSYDSLGRLTNLSDGSNTISKWRYDAINRTSEQDVNGTTIGRYYTSDRFNTERVQGSEVFTRRVVAGGVNQAVTGNSEVILCGTAQNGSLVWSRDTHSNTGRIHLWSAYGEGRVVGMLPGFNGEHLDSATKNYALGNGYRDYSPILMRFTAPDNMSPFGAGGINPYVYCDGDPANFTDPSGHLSWQAWLGIGLGIAGLLLAGVTAGASIAAAGSLSAALSSASTTALILGSISVVSDVTAIVSGALESVAPETSSILGWVSLGTGIIGLGSAVTPPTSKATRKAGSFVGSWQYKLQHAGGKPSKLKRQPSRVIKNSTVDRALNEFIDGASRNELYTRHAHGRSKPDAFYRGSAFPIQTPPGPELMDERLVAALKHTASSGGSAGGIQSFSADPMVASRFAGSNPNATVTTIRPGPGDVFMSTAEIIDLHADRLVAEGKIRAGTVASAVKQLFTHSEDEYFWLVTSQIR